MNEALDQIIEDSKSIIKLGLTQRAILELYSQLQQLENKLNDQIEKLYEKSTT